MGQRLCSPTRIMFRLNKYIYIVSVYIPSVAEMVLSEGTKLTLEQRTGYPFDEEIEILVNPEKKASFGLSLRMPEWARTAEVKKTERSMNQNSGQILIFPSTENSPG